MATIFPREEKAEQLFEKILENPDACERLKDTFYEHFPESEDMDAQMSAVSAQTFTRALFQAYQNKDLKREASGKRPGQGLPEVQQNLSAQGADPADAGISGVRFPRGAPLR